MSVDEAPVEAIIISGPRKGELICVPDGEPIPTPAEEALLESIVQSADRIAVAARDAAARMDALVQELREAQER